MSKNEKIDAVEGKEIRRSIIISKPDFGLVRCGIVGVAPLVIKRFSLKTKAAFLEKIVEGSKPRSKAKYAAADPDDICDQARYMGKTKGETWDGFNASAIRCASISACRLVNFKMTLAKLCVSVVPDGWDIHEPMIPLIKIIGEHQRTEMIGRTTTGEAMLTIRPMYMPWKAVVTMKFDRGQFSQDDVVNLLNRVGAQVGVGEGRPDSKNSAGMGWGLFEIEGEEAVKLPKAA